MVGRAAKEALRSSSFTNQQYRESGCRSKNVPAMVKDHDLAAIDHERLSFVRISRQFDDIQISHRYSEESCFRHEPIVGAVNGGPRCRAGKLTQFITLQTNHRLDHRCLITDREAVRHSMFAYRCNFIGPVRAPDIRIFSSTRIFETHLPTSRYSSRRPNKVPPSFACQDQRNTSFHGYAAGESADRIS